VAVEVGRFTSLSVGSPGGC